MEKIKLLAEVRESRGSSYSRNLRAKGQIPGVIYGKGREPLALSIDEKEIKKVIGKNSLIDLGFGEETASVVLKDIQRDPLRGNPIHFDFQEVDLKQRITITVSIHLEGTPAGIKEGGILQQTLREVDLECLPTEMPNYLKVDISHLNVGESLHVNELVVPENLTILTSPEEVVVTIVTPTLNVIEEEEDVAEEEETEAASPEEETA